MEACQRRWKTIRDRYVRELKKVKKKRKTGEAGPPYVPVCMVCLMCSPFFRIQCDIDRE